MRLTVTSSVSKRFLLNNFVEQETIAFWIENLNNEANVLVKDIFDLIYESFGAPSLNLKGYLKTRN